MYNLQEYIYTFTLSEFNNFTKAAFTPSPSFPPWVSIS